MVRAHFLIALALVFGLMRSHAFEPSEVPKSKRDHWCQSQTAACPLLCLQMPGASGTPESNDCHVDTLQYSCVCSNGQSPNSSEYSQTIPYFICTQTNNDCVANCNGLAICQTECRTSNPCGAQNPKRINVTTTNLPPTTAESTTPPSGVVYHGWGPTSTGQSKENVSPMTKVVDIGRVYGLFVVMAGIFAGFTVLL